MLTKIQKHYRKIIFAILFFMAAVSLYSAERDALIYDESAHIPAGYSYLTKQDMRLNPEHPPLLKNLSAFPLLFLNLNFDTNQAFWTQDANSAQWNAGKYFLFQAGNDPDKIIFWSRLPIILLSLILGLFLFKWGRELSGIFGGLLALCLYAFDPNILGHNHFVTTDLGIAAFTVFAFYYFLRFIKDPSWKNVFLGGFFLGLMQLVKFSSVIAFPAMGLALIGYPLVISTSPMRLRKLGVYLGKGLSAFLFSLLIVWIVYFLNTAKMPKETLPNVMSHYMHAEDPRPQTIYTRKAILALNESSLSRPLATYFFGVARVFQRVAGGNVTYYFGEISTAGFLSYFPVVFLLKEPLSTLLLFALSLLALSWLIFRHQTEKNKPTLLSRLKDLIRFHILELTLGIFVFFYLVSSITGRLNIGFRHLFPVMPILYLLVSESFLTASRKLTSQKQKTAWAVVVITLILFTLGESLSAFPYHLSYFNQLAGGPKQGYRYVTDSNADWGQDLKRLKLWIEDYNSCAKELCNPNKKVGCSIKCYSLAKPFPTPGQPLEKIRVDYFGTAEPAHYLGKKFLPWWGTKRPLEPGWYALSALFLQESIHDPAKADEASYRWTQKISPITQVGTSIFIYYLTAEDIANLH